MEDTTTSGWKLYGVWWAMSFVRQMHSRIQEKDKRIELLESDLLEWQNRTLALAHVRPLHQQPGAPSLPTSRAPIGNTMKNNMLRQRAIDKDNIGKPTDADILEAANKTVKPNGNK